MPLRIATRGSPLARWQAEHVARLLGNGAELVVVQTTGDRQADTPIWEMGGRGVFVKEVQAAVLDGRADIAVHSAKDLPSAAAPGLIIAAVPERGDARDALVGHALDDIPVGGVIATGSVRRRAQLAALRPDVMFASIRGNIGTRLEKASKYDAVVMAAVALERLGEEQRAAEILSPGTMVPQVGQGALAVECREDDQPTRIALAAIEHAPSRAAVDAERAFLAEVGGGCDLPVAAYATTDGAAEIDLLGLIARLDGHVVLRHQQRGADAVALGRAVARHILDDLGGADLLEAIRRG